MSDYNTKVYQKIGGDELVVDVGGKITLGNATLSTNAAGKFLVAGLPTADPNVVGQLWSNSGVLTVSAG